MKIGHKALSLVLTITMIIGTFASTAAFAAESQVWDSNFDSGSFHYHVTDSNFTGKDSDSGSVDSGSADSGYVDSGSINNGSVEVTYVDSGFDSYAVPQQVTYLDANYSVTAIAAGAFENTHASAITAVIKDSNVSLAVETKGTGYVSLAAVENGDITAKAIPAAGYQFDGWYDGQVKVSAQQSLALTGTTGYELVAKFKAATFTSDTNYDFTVKGSYQIRITSLNGKAPVVAVGTGGVFSVALASHSGNNYFYKFTAIGAAGAKAGIYVNGTKLLVATVGTPEATFTSDTNKDFAVKSTYQIRITSKNGKVPTFAIGTAGVFTAQFVTKVGNDYFYKLTAVGAAGAKAGIYVNGTKLLVATVGTSASSVRSDTNGSFKVKVGASYTFKLTAATKPTFVAGSSSAFKVVLVKTSGNDYFFKVTAIGKAGAASGFYINSGKTPVAVATIVK